MEIDSRNLDAESAYKLLIGAVVPRPIAWVTSVSPHGGINLAPFSCFTFVLNDPPMVAISIGRLADAPLYLGHPQSGRFNEARNPAK